MTQKNTDVNDFDEISIDNEDSSFKFTIVPNDLIRDITISPNCRWLIIYLISNKPGWKIKSKQLWQHTKGFIGRDGIRKTLNEAIEAGYIRRDIILKKTEKGSLRGYSYVVSSSPKFKKCLREPENQFPEDQEPDFQGPENQGTKEVLSSKEILSNLTTPPTPPHSADAEVASAPVESVDIPKKKRERVPSAFSCKVKEVADKMINILVTCSPVYRPPENLEKFLQAVEIMIEKEKQSPELLLKTFEWACYDNELRDKFKGWQSVVVNNKSKGKPSNPAEIFRLSFNSIWGQMNSFPRNSKVDRRTKNMDGTAVDAPHLRDLF